MLQERTLKRGGSTLHYWLTDDETKPLIVFTHGAVLDHHMFDAQIAVVATHYRVLAWDVRGHGLSQPIGENFTLPAAAEDLLAILDEIGVQQAVFVGQSMGGNLTQELVFRHPERVRALVMVDCICNTLPLTRVERAMLRLTAPLLQLYPYETLKRQTAQANAIKPETRAYIMRAIEQVSKEAFNQIWAAVAAVPHAEPEYQIAQPLLLVRGEHDHQGSIPKSMEMWAQRDSDAQYEIIPDAGHCANQDNAPYFNRVLMDFLRERVLTDAERK